MQSDLFRLEKIAQLDAIAHTEIIRLVEHRTSKRGYQRDISKNSATVGFSSLTQIMVSKIYLKNLPNQRGKDQKIQTTNKISIAEIIRKKLYKNLAKNKRILLKTYGGSQSLLQIGN